MSISVLYQYFKFKTWRKVMTMEGIKEFRQFYENASPAALRLMIHVLTEHQPNVPFPNGGELKVMFKWSDPTVYGALNELITAGILYKVIHHRKTKYFVNPGIVWNDDDESKARQIRWLENLVEGQDCEPWDMPEDN